MVKLNIYILTCLHNSPHGEHFHTQYEPMNQCCKIYKLVTFVIPINRSLTFCNQGGCRTVSNTLSLSTRCPTVLRTVPSLDTLLSGNPNSIPTG